MPHHYYGKMWGRHMFVGGRWIYNFVGLVVGCRYVGNHVERLMTKLIGVGRSNTLNQTQTELLQSIYTNPYNLELV